MCAAEKRVGLINAQIGTFQSESQREQGQRQINRRDNSGLSVSGCPCIRDVLFSLVFMLLCSGIFYSH